MVVAADETVEETEVPEEDKKTKLERKESTNVSFNKYKIKNDMF